MKSGYIYINNCIMPTLVAISEQEQAKGLMEVDPPVPNMIFPYSRPKINKFWMHKTKAPLDIIFCNNNVINQICKGEPYSTSVIGDDIFSDLIIELPFGTAKEFDFKVGHNAGLVNPSKEQLKVILAEYEYSKKY
jgi:uncharacterized membrane protein (UPF0127 family)